MPGQQSQKPEARERKRFLIRQLALWLRADLVRELDIEKTQKGLANREDLVDLILAERYGKVITPGVMETIAETERISAYYP